MLKFLNSMNAAKFTLLLAITSVTGQPLALSSSEGIEDIRSKLQKGMDPHEVALSANTACFRAENSGDRTQQLAACKRAASLAALLLETCDPALHSKIGMTHVPEFDWSKYGLKAPFGRENPANIDHLEAREAYAKKLQEHDELFKRVYEESSKLDDADYCMTVARLLTLSATGREDMIGEIKSQITNSDNAPWIKDRLLAGLAPQPSDPPAKTNTKRNTAPPVSPPPAQLPADSTAAAVTPALSVNIAPAQQAADVPPTNGWLIGGGLAAVAASIVLFLRGRRSK